MVQLSNTSPAIAGSNILFKAVVYDGTSHPVQDEKYFVYNWFNPLDGYKVCNNCGSVDNGWIHFFFFFLNLTYISKNGP